MARAARGKTGGVVTTAGDRSWKLPQPTTVTHDDVARRAYDLYLARGGEHGHDEDDWLQAEQELRARSATA
jgi:hypothetical protein